MDARLKLWQMKARLSAATLVWLFRKWRYAVLAAVLAVLFFELVYWLFNLELFASLMTSGALSLGDKLTLVVSPFAAVKDASGQTLFAMMIILSIVQGISLAALIYAIRHQPQVDSKLLGGSTIAGLLAVIGLGCPACGTSLVTPLVATVASGSAVAISEKITAIALPIAILVGLYGLYTLGLRLSTIRAHQQSNAER